MEGSLKSARMIHHHKRKKPVQKRSVIDAVFYTPASNSASEPRTSTPKAAFERTQTIMTKLLWSLFRSGQRSVHIGHPRLNFANFLV